MSTASESMDRAMRAGVCVARLNPCLTILFCTHPGCAA
jgi:hypothetical protein